MGKVLADRCEIGRMLRRLRWKLRCRIIDARNRMHNRRLPRVLRRNWVLYEVLDALLDWLSRREIALYFFLIRVVDWLAGHIADGYCYWGDPDDRWARVAISRIV
jgi:hypothetical protein